MADVNALRRELQKHGQEHLLQFHDRLPPQRQAALLEQIERLDLPWLDGLIDRYVRRKPSYAPTGRIEPPAIVPVASNDPNVAKQKQEALRHGQQLLAAGKVAAFVVAGGQGTRLGYEGPKGCLEVTPVSHKPLFQVFAEQILAAGRRAGVPVPWYVMTSPTNDVATRAFFRQKGYFGLDERDVFFLVQGTMPAISPEGKLLLAAPDSLALSPDGHGSSLVALRRSGALEDMAARGVELISYFQVDNPLVRVLDPVFLGLHEMRGAEMSAKCLPKRDPMEKLGNFCCIDGKVHVIEYSDMPEDLARATTEDGRLRFSAGSIAIHVLRRSFVERLVPETNSHSPLPFHRAEKVVPHVDAAGRVVQPAAPNAVKLETFVFDALPLASETVILETLRSEEFSPIKNAVGTDSLNTCLHDQVRRAAAWLEAAGVKVPRDADGQIAAAIEISPLYADSAEALARKVTDGLVVTPGQNLYLE